MEKYGSILINGVFLIIMIVGLWVIVDQIGELVGKLISSQEASTQTLNAITNAISKLDQISNGGSGIIPA